MKRLAVLAALVLAACSAERDPSVTTHLAEPGDAIGQDLMIALGQAKNYHHKAKILMADGNTAGAVAAVRQILSLTFPRGAPEAEDVRNDARALLAKLLLGQGQLEEATQVIAEGLAQSARDSFFKANLYTVQGELHEARAAGFDAQGEAGKALAVDQRKQAIAAYDQSIRINEQLQKTLMEQR
ncbi:MAG TPA: hypothetical protein VGC42_18525 [Kofleriaceae bacterium]